MVLAEHLASIPVANAVFSSHFSLGIYFIELLLYCALCRSRNSALASLREGNKKLALRYTKELKLASQSRERCSALFDQVEKVLQAIMDAESSEKVGFRC